MVDGYRLMISVLMITSRQAMRVEVLTKDIQSRQGRLVDRPVSQ